MAASIPETHTDLLKGKNFASLATLMPDGSPQVTPVWIDFDGKNLLVNTADGRQKVRNLDRDGRVAVSVFDMENPYRYIQVRGKVVEKTKDGAEEHIDALAKRYMGVDTYPYKNPAEPRVIYKILPEKVQATG